MIYQAKITSKKLVDAGAAKGQSQPILVHVKGDNKSKSNKPSAA